MDPTIKKPALISGGALGLLASIGSIFGGLGCCCCIPIALGAGVLSAKLYQNEVGGRGVQPAEGAKVGVIAGAIGAAIQIVLGIPLVLLLGAVGAAMATQTAEGPFAQVAGAVGGLVAVFLGAALNIGLAAAGGALGAAIFKGPATPTAPPPYPGPGAGGPYSPGPGGPYGQGGPGY